MKTSTFYALALQAILRKQRKRHLPHTLMTLMRVFIFYSRGYILAKPKLLSKALELCETTSINDFFKATKSEINQRNILQIQRQRQLLERQHHCGLQEEPKQFRTDAMWRETNQGSPYTILFRRIGTTRRRNNARRRKRIPYSCHTRTFAHLTTVSECVTWVRTLSPVTGFTEA